MEGDGQQNQIDEYVFTREDVDRWIKDNDIINYSKKYFKRLNNEGAVILIKRLLDRKLFKAIEINATGSTGFYTNNQKMFDVPEGQHAHYQKNPNLIKDLMINLEKFEEMRKELITFIRKIDTAEKDFIKLDNMPDDREDECCYVRGQVKFETLRKKLCDEAGYLKFVYDFINPDIPIGVPRNTTTLQHVNLQILSPGVKFDYPLVYKYRCDLCAGESSRKSYEVVSSNNRIKCQERYTYQNANGEQKERVCNNVLSPDKDLSINKDAYFYDIGYEDKTKFIATAFSFTEYKPGHYECVMYKISSGRTEMFFIVDVKKIAPNNFKFPEQVPNENYLFTIQKAYDAYIKEKVGVEIYGLNAIKCSMIMQSMLSSLKERLILNVMIVGDPSTGKSMLLKYYSFMLYNYYNMSTNGISVSIPGLRGTKSSINLFGKDIKIVTIGHLGTYRGIHIDEAGENPELVQNLKSFLLEDDYSYDKAGSTGVSNERTAHVNLSQNLDYEHVGQYRGAIRKAYKDLNMTIGGIEKEEWDEEWDLFLPLHEYSNPHLHKIVKEKRLEFKQKQTWWIDGLDYALHERFPFYFYLTNEKDNDKLDAIIGENNTRQAISKKLEVIRALNTEDIDKFYATLLQYKFCPDDIKAYKQVDKIISQYGHNFDTRMKTVYYTIVRLSRIINRRLEYREMDFDLVRWYLETTNTKLDIIDTDNYIIKGAPNKDLEIKRTIQEEESKSHDESFGLPQGEF